MHRTINNPIGVLNDLSGLENLFSLAKETKVRKIFFSSSSEVYGEPVELPQKEYLPLLIQVPYVIKMWESVSMEILQARTWS